MLLAYKPTNTAVSICRLQGHVVRVMSALSSLSPVNRASSKEGEEMAVFEGYYSQTDKTMNT